MSTKKIKKGIRLLKDALINLPIYWSLMILKRVPRMKETSTKIFGKKFAIPDSASFISTYKEIFIKQIYKFSAESSKPYIIDCGANTGISILYFKKIYPEAEIVGFEPDSKIFKILEDNLRTFNLKAVTIINKAVWKSEGKVSFYSQGGDSGRISENKNLGNMINAETVSLKGFITKPVDLLKIDIEGSEDDVIKDIEPLLKNVKNIFIEYHSIINKNQTLHDILAILNKAGFRYHIQSATKKVSSPFVSAHISKMQFDNQLNIFAQKNIL